ncbi:hypothetical protein ACFLU5_16145 [Bacteroidota bacterium]
MIEGLAGIILVMYIIFGGFILLSLIYVFFKQLSDRDKENFDRRKN